MLSCPKCSHVIFTKAGFVGGRQRYKCKSCNCRYTVKQRSSSGTTAIKRQALQLYLEGTGFRAIGRILNFSNVSVLRWIRSFGKNLDELKSEKQIKVVEMDEMHSYAGNKKTTAGSGLLLIDIGIDSSIALLASGTQKPEKISGSS